MHHIEQFIMCITHTSDDIILSESVQEQITCKYICELLELAIFSLHKIFVKCFMNIFTNFLLKLFIIVILIMVSKLTKGDIFLVLP